MRLFLFLDDWFLDSKIDVVRHFPQASPIQIPEGYRFARVSIIYSEENKCYLAMKREKNRNKILFPSLYKSTDGINWEKTNKKLKFQYVDKPNEKIVSLPDAFPFQQGLFYDKWDKDVNRRYKMTIWPYPTGWEGGDGLIASSPDGINWGINTKYAWLNKKKCVSADTMANIFYNPFTKRWCVISRKRKGDRRISIFESNDLEHWAEPTIILHPDVLDPPLLQFYGMVGITYEDEYFIGMLQCFHVPALEINKVQGRVEMYGKVDAQFTYSYNGQCWLRSDRSTIIPVPEPGSYGSGGIYPFSIVKSPDKDKIYIYSIGALRDHSKPPSIAPSGYPSGESLLLHSLRYDGFTYLEPVGGWGQFTTRTLVPDSGNISLNYKAPVGTVLVQVADSTYKPIKGFSFQDCIPLQGDEIYGRVRWKRHNNLSKLVGKPIRLMIKLFDARIYAIRIDCKLWYVDGEPMEYI